MNPRVLPHRPASLPWLLALALAACGDSGGETTATTASESETSEGAATATTGVSGQAAAPDPTAGVTTEGETDATAGETTSMTGAMTEATGESGETTGGFEDLVMTPEDFGCILDWDKVRNLRITNLLGHLDEALAVASSPDGGEYPVGTVIQLVPTEAMVKRGAGTSPVSSDWEYFFLEVSDQGTAIANRGFADVVNGFGGNCQDCHSKAAPQWDFICEKDHGCDPLPLTDELIMTLQEGDPRCP